jgi:hypothetical protein
MRATRREVESLFLFGVGSTGRRGSPTISWLMLHCKQRLYRINHQFVSTPETPILRPDRRPADPSI